MHDARSDIYRAARDTGTSPIDALALAYGPGSRGHDLDFDLFADVPATRGPVTSTKTGRSKAGPWGARDYFEHGDRRGPARLSDVDDAERCNRRAIRGKRPSRSKVR